MARVASKNDFFRGHAIVFIVIVCKPLAQSVRENAICIEENWREP